MYNLRRVRDGAGDSGGMSRSYYYKLDGIRDDGHIPIVGNHQQVGSLNTRAYSGQDYWTTTPVTEILEEIKGDDSHYIKFRTRNSDYEWWYGDKPNT